MRKKPCCDKSAVKRGHWSVEEDRLLKSYIEEHGIGCGWVCLPQKAERLIKLEYTGLRRCEKSCRLRWLNYLRPGLKHGNYTAKEKEVICKLYSMIGSRWSVMVAWLPGRTDNDIKNHWNTQLKHKWEYLRQLYSTDPEHVVEAETLQFPMYITQSNQACNSKLIFSLSPVQEETSEARSDTLSTEKSNTTYSTSSSTKPILVNQEILLPNINSYPTNSSVIEIAQDQIFKGSTNVPNSSNPIPSCSSTVHEQSFEINCDNFNLDGSDSGILSDLLDLDFLDALDPPLNIFEKNLEQSTESLI